MLKYICQNGLPLLQTYCHSSEQAPTVNISSPRPTCKGDGCSEDKLVGICNLCLSSYGSPSQGDPENMVLQFPHHINSPRLARNALLLEPSAALNGDPTSTTNVNNTSQTVPQPSVPQHLNLHAWCLGVDYSKNKASL